MAIDRTEEEQIEALKAWWKEYGGAIVVGVVLGVGFLGGYKYWQRLSETRAAEASAIYEKMRGALKTNKIEEARGLGTRLDQDYAATPYRDLALLALARLDVDKGDPKAAMTRLQGVIDDHQDPGAAHLARLRLARLQMDAGQVDAALKLIDGAAGNGFAADYLELRGDLLLLKGDREGARKAYLEASSKLAPNSGYRDALRMKLADMGKAQQ